MYRNIDQCVYLCERNAVCQVFPFPQYTLIKYDNTTLTHFAVELPKTIDVITIAYNVCFLFDSRSFLQSYQAVFSVFLLIFCYCHSCICIPKYFQLCISPLFHPNCIQREQNKETTLQLNKKTTNNQNII